MFGVDLEQKKDVRCYAVLDGKWTMNGRTMGELAPMEARALSEHIAYQYKYD